MEFPENRGHFDTPEEVETAEPEPEGITCKWCKAIGNHPVQRTYPNKMRIRKCLQCRREFQTWESTV